MNNNVVRWLVVFLTGCAFVVAQPLAARTPASALVTCPFAPLELPLFGGTPVSLLATPPAPAGSQIESPGEDELRLLLQQYVACINTGDPQLIWAIFSPGWYARTFADPEQHYLPAFEQILDAPGNVDNPPLEFVDLVAFERLEDGRLDVTATFRSGDQEWTDSLTLVQVDGRWMIDDFQLDVSGG